MATPIHAKPSLRIVWARKVAGKTRNPTAEVPGIAEVRRCDCGRGILRRTMGNTAIDSARR
jgi:hypothetical protein